MYHKWQSYDVWILRHEVPRTEFFVILERLLPFYLPNNPKNQNFEKNEKKKKPGEFIILHICTVNDGHMMYGSWDMKHDRQNFLSFWTVYPPLFCPFTPLTVQKSRFLENKTKHLEILHHFTHVYQKLWSDDVRFLRYGAQRTDGRMDESDIYRWESHLKNP